MTKGNGYKNPPKKHRFKKGQSGNPKGRPKKERSFGTSTFDDVLGQNVTVQENGIPRELSLEEALQHKLFNDAMNGNMAAIKKVFGWIAKRHNYIEKNRKKEKPKGAELCIEPVDPDNADEAMRILDIAHEYSDPNPEFCDTKTLLLEPWVTQFALSKRKGGSKLTEDEVSWIKLCTKKPETLNWPRGTSHG